MWMTEVNDGLDQNFDIITNSILVKFVFWSTDSLVKPVQILGKRRFLSD
jgi:hypothetical protein